MYCSKNAFFFWGVGGSGSSTTMKDSLRALRWKDLLTTKFILCKLKKNCAFGTYFIQNYCSYILSWSADSKQFLKTDYRIIYMFTITQLYKRKVLLELYFSHTPNSPTWLESSGIVSNILFWPSLESNSVVVTIQRDLLLQIIAIYHMSNFYTWKHLQNEMKR